MSENIISDCYRLMNTLATCCQILLAGRMSPFYSFLSLVVLSSIREITHRRMFYRFSLQIGYITTKTLLHRLVV